MSTLPGSPRVLKGALVTLTETGETHSTISFQYNPDTLQRVLKARMTGGTSGQPVELFGPPTETITFDADLDANDQPATGQQNEADDGIHPALAALELLLYPSSAQITQINDDSKKGVVAIRPVQVPLTLLVWGRSRVLPVRLDSLTIKEESFDADLNPLRASVRITLQVLSYLDLGLNSQGGSQFMSHQRQKESLARDYASGNVDSNNGNSTLSVAFPSAKGTQFDF